MDEVLNKVKLPIEKFTPRSIRDLIACITIVCLADAKGEVVALDLEKDSIPLNRLISSVSNAYLYLTYASSSQPPDIK